MLPRKKKAQKYEPANSTQVSQAREILKAASLKYHKNPTRSSKQQLTKARKNLDTAYLNAEADFIMGKIVTLEHLHSSNKHHAAWKTVKELSGKSNASPRIKRGSNKARTESWLRHFQNLLGKKANLPENLSLPMEEISSELNIPTTIFTLDELKNALKQIKPAKAFGPDNIPAIIWKDEHFYELLLKLCNYAFEHKRCPSYWRKSQIIPVPKKGDLSLVTNYRGISLLPIAAKI